MNGVNFRYGKYMNGSCFSLGLVYEWGGVRGLQPHIRTQNHGKLPPRVYLYTYHCYLPDYHEIHPISISISVPYWLSNQI